jgi:EAL domain-containing protein (putative c-di-GMP-specific phosphodiesterase class I)
MDDIERSQATLTQLQDAGFRMSVDDFGTGYSSLAYLQRFPLNALKIDRSFVDGLGQESEDTSLVRAVTSLGRALDLEVIAEGVETAEQLSALVDLGCDFGQGYLWSPGVPPEDAVAWITPTNDPDATGPVTPS